MAVQRFDIRTAWYPGRRVETNIQYTREHGLTAEVAPHARDRGGEEQAWRARVYSLLAALLAAPPKATILETLSRIDAESDAGAMAGAWRSLKQAAATVEIDALDDEYHALFIGVGRGELLPYGSWYLTGFLMERPLAVLRGTLRSLGIERQAGVREPEDHAAALCETMSLIIGSPDDIDFGAQRLFFRAYVAPWMDQFFHDLQHAESAHFYRAVGKLGEEFIKVEQRYFEMMS